MRREKNSLGASFRYLGAWNSGGRTANKCSGEMCERQQLIMACRCACCWCVCCRSQPPADISIRVVRCSNPLSIFHELQIRLDRERLLLSD